MRTGPGRLLAPRYQVGVILVLALGLVWAFIAYDLQRLSRLMAAGNRAQTENLALAFAEEVSSSINSVDYTLVDLRDEWRSRPQEFAQTVRARQAFLERDVGFQVAIIDAAGRLAYSSADPQAKPVDLSDREHFRVHIDSEVDRLFVSSPVLGRVSNRWSIQFTRRILDRAGRFAGVIVLSVAPSYFSRFYTKIRLPADSSVALVRSNGEILARSPQPELVLGRSMRSAALPPGAGQSGSSEADSQVDGVRRLYAWRSLPGRDLAVVIGQAVDALEAPYRAQRRTYVRAGAGISLILLLFGYFWIRTMVQRARDLDALSRSEARMQVILENSHDAFVAADTEGRITDWNTKAEATFGRSRADVLGKRLVDIIIPEEQRAAHQAGFARFTASGKSTLIDKVIEVEALHRSGRRIPVELALGGFRSEGGFVAHAFIRDIGARKEAQRVEAQQKKALEEARSALHHAQKLEAIGKLTGGVAHDFNNVLQVISGNLQLLQVLFPHNDQLQARVASAIGAVDRGAKLSGQLLAFARRQPLQPRRVDMRSTIENMRDLLVRAVGEAIRVQTVIPRDLWPVFVDPNQLENVVLNIALNARDAMSGQGSLTLELSNVVLGSSPALPNSELAPGEYVELKIMDTGTGMDKETMERAFEPFFTTKPEGAGTGLGLSMAYGFLKQSGGHIRIASALGEGTTVSIYLPRSLAAAPEISEEPEDGPARGSETILVVEDDAEVQETTVATLEELGYHVLKADDGERALDIVKRRPHIDLLFTDVVMPGRYSGPEMAREAQRLLPGLSVLYTSGYTRDALGKDGLLEPGIFLLRKPYQREQLARAVRHFFS
jgi:PAS domain S-box-containing protein